jgi:hypothetical protein
MEVFKEGYIIMRNSKTLNNKWLFEYYKSEGGYLNSMEEFLEVFYYEHTPIVVNGHNFGMQKSNRDLGNFLEDMDKKFGLQTIWDKEGNFVKVVI